MAVFSKKVVMLLLAVLVLLSIALRYPQVEHERFQTDSYTVHLFAKSIADAGYAKWTFHPLSYIGYYPISYPSGTPFLLAELSETTGLNLESSILLIDWLLGIVFAMAVFLFARQFIRTPDYALLASFFAITGARFVDTTYWDASARGPMIVYLVLFLLVLFRAGATGQRRLLSYAIPFGIGCLVTHHMAVLIILFGLSYALAGLQISYILPRILIRKRVTAAAIGVAIAASIAAVSFGFFAYFSDLALMNLRESSLFNMNPPALSIALNMVASYTNQIGFIILFAALGIPILFKERRLSLESLFLVTSLVVFIPTYANSLYVSMILAPLVCILGVGYFAKMLKTARRRRVTAIVLSALMLSSIFLPIWSSDRWNAGGDYLSGQKVEVDARVYSDATYLRSQYPGVYGISNANTYWIQLGVFSNTKFLASGVPLAINDDVTSSAIEGNVTWSSAIFPSNLYDPFDYPDEPAVDLYVLNLVVSGYRAVANQTGFASVKEYFSNHPRLIVAVDNSLPNSYADTYNLRDAKLLMELREASSGNGESLQSYMIYASGSSALYAVDLGL